MNSYVLYRIVLFLVTLTDPEVPQNTSCSTFCIAFHVFVTGGDRDLKFDT